MAIQKVTDGFTVAQSAGATYEGNASDQIYTIHPTLTSAGDTITIIDQGGNNTIELAGGLTIASSVSVADETQLTLSNGAIVNIRGADTFTFAVGANTAAGQTGQDKTFAEFATDVLGVTLPAAGDAAVPSTVSVDIEVGGGTTTGPVDPGNPTTPTDPDFTLTAAKDDEILNGTASNDIFDATQLGSLQDGDIIIDTATNDADVLNAAINTADTKARITNVETLNLTGEFVKTGFNLTNVSNAQNVNLDTKILGGTATVTGANSLNASNINAGDNIGTLNVKSLTSGTRDTVTVDAGSADTVVITGETAGTDQYDLSVAKGAEVTLSTLDGAADKVALQTDGDIKLKSGNGTNMALTLSATAAASVELTKGANVAKDIFLTGGQDITLVSSDGKDLLGTHDGTDTSTGTAVKQGNADDTVAMTGVSTIEIETLVAETTITKQSLANAAVDVVELSKNVAGDTSLLLNAATKLNLTSDLAAGDIEVGLDNGIDDKAFNTGALSIDVSQSQTTKDIKTSSTVDTLILMATPDEVKDLDTDENGFDEAVLSVNTVTTHANTTATVIRGDQDLSLSEVVLGGLKQVISAADMTGDLAISKVTVTGTAAGVVDATVVGGTGADNITTATAYTFDVQTGEGQDTVDVASSKDLTEVDTGAGSDTVYSSKNSTEIDLGAGDDAIVTAGKDTLILGDGTDTVTLGDNDVSVVVKDFVKGTDAVVLSGSLANGEKSIDLTNLTVVDGLYQIADTKASAGTLGAGEWHITLENDGSKLSDKDLSDSIALSVTLASDVNSTIVAGSLNDSVTVAADLDATITTGAGNDTVTMVVDGGTASSDTTITDFTVGSDTVVLTGIVSKEFSVNLKNVSDTSGEYQVGDTGSNKGFAFTLQNGGSDIVTDNDLTGIVQLGTSSSAFVVDADTAAVSATGGNFNDHVELADGATGFLTTFNFSANGGVDTITMAVNTDTGGDGVIAGKFSQVNFNNLAGIDSTAGKFDQAANAAKVADAVDKAVYVFAESSDGAGSSKIKTLVVDADNGYTQDAINAEVAAYLDANLGVSAGENYIAVINDTSTAGYFGASQSVEAYAYLITGDSDGIQADNITLIGMLEDKADNTANFSVLDIV